MINRKELIKQFKQYFLNEPELVFISHGRVELIGNHTDHNLGKCMSFRCDKAIHAAVRKREDNLVRFLSKNHNLIEIDINDLNKREDESGHSPSLVRGVLSYLKNEGYNLCGFDAFSVSNIPTGSGLSSSAAFELLVANIINKLANEEKIDKITLAKAGRYAENEYFDKACGLLDQISVAFSEIKYIDFKDMNNIVVNTYSMPFDVKMLLVNTLGSHAGLNAEYSSIPTVMKSASRKLGVKYLRETSLDVLNNNLSKLNEEEIKKSTHFFLENERVDKTVKALIDKDLDSFLKNINESCLSSEKLLNNTMLDEILDSPQEVIDYVREINPAGAVKINGGGFKGTVVIYIQKENYESVKEKLLAKFDKRVIEVDIAKDNTPYLSVEQYLL